MRWPVRGVDSGIGGVQGQNSLFAWPRRWHFGRWRGVRSDVIYTIMSDEQQRQRLKGPRAE
jgi:hypothetical protein